MSQREYKIPEEHHERVKELSRANNHASIRAQMASTRLQNLMQAGVEVEATLEAFDERKALSVAAIEANTALWDLLKEVQWKIKDDEKAWSLASDDKTLIYDAPARPANGTPIIHPARF